MPNLSDDQYRRLTEAVRAAQAVLTEIGDAVPPPTTPPVTEPLRSFNSFWINWNGYVPTQEEITREANRRSYVLLNSWQGDLAEKIKAANPKVKIFAYKDASSTRDYDHNTIDAMLPTGVSYYRAQEDWFLKDANGNKLKYGSNYPGHWQMDIGHPGYQIAWVQNVNQFLADEPVFDGVLIDNLLWVPDDYHPGVSPARYTTVTSFQGAYKSFLSYVRTRLTPGKLMLGNVTNARLGEGRYESYTAYLDGAWDEWWLTFADNNKLPEYAEGWSRQVDEIRKNDNAGKITLVSPHGSSDVTFRYALASYYMGVGRNTKAAFMPVTKTDGYGAPTVWPMDMGVDLGQPKTPAVMVRTNVWVREFEKGLAVVNAGTTRQTVNFNKPYQSVWGSSVTSVTLDGTSGAIFKG